MKDFFSVVQHNYNITLNSFRNNRAPLKLVGGIGLSSDLFVAGLKDEVITNNYNIKDRKAFRNLELSGLKPFFPMIFRSSSRKVLNHFDLGQSRFLSKKEVSVLKILARIYTFNRGLVVDKKYSLQSNFYAYKGKISSSKFPLYVWHNFGEKKKKFLSADFLNHCAFTDFRKRRFKKRSKKKGLTSFFLGTRFFLAFRSSKLQVMPFTYKKWISQLSLLVVKFFIIYKFLFKIDVSSLSPYILKRLYKRLKFLLLKIKEHRFKFLKLYLGRSRVHKVSLLFYTMSYMQFLVLSPFGFSLSKYLSKFVLVYDVVSLGSFENNKFFISDSSSIIVYNLLLSKLCFQSVLPLVSDISLYVRRVWFVLSNVTNFFILNKWVVQGLTFDFKVSNKFSLLLYFFYSSILDKFSLNYLNLFFSVPFVKTYFSSNFLRSEIFRTYGFLKLFRLRVSNSFILPFHWSRVGLPTEVDNNFTYFKRDNYLDRRIISTALARQGYKQRFKKFKLRRSSRLFKVLFVRGSLFLNMVRSLNNQYSLLSKLSINIVLKSLILRFLYNKINIKRSTIRFLHLLRKIYKFNIRNKKFFSFKNYKKGQRLLFLPYRFIKRRRKPRAYRFRRTRLHGFRYIGRLRMFNALNLKDFLHSRKVYRFNNYKSSLYKSSLKIKYFASFLFARYLKRQRLASLRRRFLQKNKHRFFRFNKSSYKGKRKGVLFR
jgi:hypothetical protein